MIRDRSDYHCRPLRVLVNALLVLAASTFGSTARAENTFLNAWKSGGTGNGQFITPCGVAVSPTGDVYVADGDNNHIQKFDSSGGILLMWGSMGSGNGQFSFPDGCGWSEHL